MLGTKIAIISLELKKDIRSATQIMCNGEDHAISSLTVFIRFSKLENIIRSSFFEILKDHTKHISDYKF